MESTTLPTSVAMGFVFLMGLAATVSHPANGPSSQVQLWLAIALLVILFVVGIWDIYASYWIGSGNTVSYLIQSWSLQFPALPLLVGFLLGHLFWPIRR